jgi:hypothetical protein
MSTDHLVPLQRRPDLLIGSRIFLDPLTAATSRLEPGSRGEEAENPPTKCSDTRRSTWLDRVSGIQGRIVGRPLDAGGSRDTTSWRAAARRSVTLASWRWWS